MTRESLGYGGVGDCLIIILKLLEGESNQLYTHIESTKEKLLMCGELLNIFNVNHKLIHTPNLRHWWQTNHYKFDKCFNVCAHGRIKCPPRDFHWQPCIDEGLKNPHTNNAVEKKYDLCIQVNGGVKNEGKKRHINKRPILEYLKKINFNESKVCWVGIEETNPPFGKSFSGKSSLKQTLEVISQSKKFIGFNSILLYWALYNKIESHLFMDHQGKYDIRIHDDWKKYLTYIDD